MPVKQIPIFDFDRVFGPPPGFEYPTEISSQISATEAFETGIDKRDICCVICGATFEKTLDLTYIVPRDERDLVISSHHQLITAGQLTFLSFLCII